MSGDRVYPNYVLDLAEMPPFPEGDRVGAPGFAGELRPRLGLVVDGRRRRLRPLDSDVRTRPGTGGLETLRFEAVYVAGASGRAPGFHDRNFAERIGWKEVVVRATRDARIESASVPSRSVGPALRRCPRDLLQGRSRSVRRRPASKPARCLAELLGAAASHRPKGKGGSFESLISQERLGLGAILLSLTLATLWGAVHALSPGHGKALVASYLVGGPGRRRTPRLST
jgi:nickel/cobalt transporter (NicO) family protein